MDRMKTRTFSGPGDPTIPEGEGFWGRGVVQWRGFVTEAGTQCAMVPAAIRSRRDEK